MIDKEYLRTKVKQAIETMPYTALVTRNELDIHNEPKDEPIPICILTGFKYLKENKLNVILKDKGEVKESEDIRFLVDLNEDSILVKEGDFIKIDEVEYKINFLGNTNEVCFDMKLEVI